MDDNYLDEVLPRWQFWKEFLIAKMEDYKEGFKGEYPEAFKKCAEMIKKIKKVENAESLEEIAEEARKFIRSMERDLELPPEEYAGIFHADVNVTSYDKVSAWVNAKKFPEMINRKK